LLPRLGPSFFSLSAIIYARPVKLRSKGSKRNLFHWGAMNFFSLLPALSIEL
jgi:hypothetical protein